jgi:predicted phosphodiesterase
MAETSTLKSKLYALLIGVDCYLPNRLPDGGYYPSLGGCVRDINLVEHFLKSRLGLPAAQILKLTATNNGTPTPPEPKEQWPTYENMVQAFKKITDTAQSGEQVYIHYSGHGGRSVTSFPKVKGLSGLDESLVPTDIGNSEARYLRDLEIAHLLKSMTDKGLALTVVFDSCHSGGATRGGDSGVAVRGIDSIDTTPRPTSSLVASTEELEQGWQAPEATRSGKLSSGWLPEIKGGVFLAACRANELANEFAFEGSERNGALTYWLLDSLKQLGPGLTFDMLHDRILAKVHAKFQQQTPQLQGDGSRVVFQTTAIPRPPSARVLEVDQTGRRVKVEAGRAQGIGQGAHFAIYAAGATNFTDEAAWLALVEASDVQDTESWTTIVDARNAAAISEDSQAVLLDAGDVYLKGRIRLVRRDDLPADIDQVTALRDLEREIGSRKWIHLAERDEAADYQVAVNFNGEYEVWEPSGRIVPNLRPALKITDNGTASAMADRLVHLTKYANVKLIENSASTAPLARLIELTVTGQTAKGPGGETVVDEGEHLTFVIRNASAQDALNVTVFDLQPDWSISKLFPPDADSVLLDPRSTTEVPLEFELPSGYKESLETIKVFATVGNTSFDWLQLPALDNPLQVMGAKRSPGNALETLMAEFSADAPPQNKTRARLSTVALAKWTTAQADVLVRRRPPAITHVRDASTSLLQSAFEEVSENHKRASRAARGEGEPAPGATRASVSDPLDNAITTYFADPTALPDAVSRPREGTTRGAWDTVKYCADMAKGMAGELWNAKVLGDDKKYNEYKAALTTKFGDCDPRFGEAVTQYAEFLLRRGEVPYRRWRQLSDFVIEGTLPADASIGLIADWATGQAEALEVLRQVKQRNPQIVIHLGDIYYAGTATEVENFFYRPWLDILQPETSNITSLVLPGNHDLYSGGQPFYALLDKLKQPASYFCLRNADWQLIGLDTALHDRLGGPPTTLEPSEVEWLRDKIENSGNRRTVLMSHHQLFSTNEQFGDQKKSYNPLLHAQLAALLAQVDLWLWGHEHDLVIFGEYMGLKRGRCIGGSAFPVGKYEMPQTPSNPDVPYNKQVVLSKSSAFYQHCYAVMKLNGRAATVDYYEDSDGGRRLFSEEI